MNSNLNVESWVDYFSPIVISNIFRELTEYWLAHVSNGQIMSTCLTVPRDDSLLYGSILSSV